MKKLKTPGKDNITTNDVLNDDADQIIHIAVIKDESMPSASSTKFTNKSGLPGPYAEMGKKTGFKFTSFTSTVSDEPSF